MRYLVDANVLSEPTRPAPDPKVIEWLRRHERDIAVDPVILGEVRFVSSGFARGGNAHAWSNGLTLASSASIACRWTRTPGCDGRSMADLRAAGHAMPIKDSLIATTALVHDLTVVTRNRTGFAHAGVRIIDPFAH